MDQADEANERQKGLETLMGGFSTFLQNTHKEKTEKEKKEKEEKEKKEQKGEEKKQRYIDDRNKVLLWMAIHYGKNQAVPQSVITRGTLGVNISIITLTSNSNKQIVLSPRLTYNHTPVNIETKEQQIS